MTISNQIRKAIRDCGLTRYRLSQLTGIHESTLSKFMSGSRGLSMAGLDALAPVIRMEVRSKGVSDFLKKKYGG
jgi:transcriptional regulator with XRE-family HTH domain